MSKFSLFVKKFLGGFVKKLYRIRIIGAENEPENGPFIVCSNHISNHDVVVLFVSMKSRMRFLAKAELFKIPVLVSVGYIINNIVNGMHRAAVYVHKNVYTVHGKFMHHICFLRTTNNHRLNRWMPNNCF